MKPLNAQQLTSEPRHITSIPRTDVGGRLIGHIEVVGVDPFYEPLVEAIKKPVACIYILYRDPRQPAHQRYYRAVYLKERTVMALVNSIALKWDLESTKIARLVYVLSGGGPDVEVDDHVIRELTDGQQIIMEVSERESYFPSRVRRELHIDGAVQSRCYELKLLF